MSYRLPKRESLTYQAIILPLLAAHELWERCFNLVSSSDLIELRGSLTFLLIYVYVVVNRETLARGERVLLALLKSDLYLKKMHYSESKHLHPPQARKQAKGARKVSILILERTKMKIMKG